MKLEILKRGDLTLYAGEVVACNEGTGAAAGKVVDVKIKAKIYDKAIGAEKDATVEIAFWNSEKANLADRVIKAGVGVGSFITCLARPTEEGKAIGINFKYSGIWKFPEEENLSEMNVIVGTVASLTSDNDGRYVRLSVPVKVSPEDTTWYNVTFWNSEKANLADRAAKCLKPRNDGTKAKAILVCSKMSEYNGKPSCSGFRFELLPKKE